MKHVLAILFISLFSLQAFSLSPKEGQETNGGDAYAAEFFLLLDGALQRMPQYVPLSNDVLLSRDTLTDVRIGLKVISAETVLLDGGEVAAINTPLTTPPTITVSRSIWNTLTQTQKIQLVLHEVLPVAGIKDKDYKNSLKVFEQLQDQAPLNYYSIDKAVSTCDRQAISTLTTNSFLAMTTPSQQLSLFILALQQNCAPFIEQYRSWNQNMDICVGKQSLLNWYLRQTILSQEALDIIKILKDAEVPNIRTCGLRQNDVCKDAFPKAKSPDESKAAAILGCSSPAPAKSTERD